MIAILVEKGARDGFDGKKHYTQKDFGCSCLQLSRGELYKSSTHQVLEKDFQVDFCDFRGCRGLYEAGDQVAFDTYFRVNSNSLVYNCIINDIFPGSSKKATNKA